VGRQLHSPSCSGIIISSTDINLLISGLFGVLCNLFYTYSRKRQTVGPDADLHDIYLRPGRRYFNSRHNTTDNKNSTRFILKLGERKPKQYLALILLSSE